MDSGDPAVTRIVRALDPDAVATSVRRLAGGISASTLAVELRSPDRPPDTVVVRVPERAAAAATSAVTAEFALLRQLRARGLPVPEPRLLDARGEVWGRPALVLGHVAGAPCFDRKRWPQVAPGLAETLAAIHDVDGGQASFAGLPRAGDIAADRLARRPDEPDRELSEDRIRAALAACPLPPEPARPALLHGDFWPGNVIWRDGRVAAVVDWEQPAVGDPLADVGISRLDVLWVFGAEAMAAFTRTYVARRACDPGSLAWWDLAAALRPAGRLSSWAAQYPDLGRPDVTTATMRAAHRWFVDEALSALDRGGPNR